MHSKTSFGRDKASPSGYAYACKEVVSARNRSYHARHRDKRNKYSHQQRLRRKQSPDRIEWVLKKMLSDAKRRARRKGIEFAIRVCDLEVPEHCPAFGTKLVYQADVERLPESASLDRIDSAKGYIPENVWIISWRANSIKSDATPEELYAVADAVSKKVEE